MAVCAETSVEELRAVYSSGKTRTYEWRVSQLKALLKVVLHHEKEIGEALHSDLNKPEHEAYLHEVREFELLEFVVDYLELERVCVCVLMVND